MSMFLQFAKLSADTVSVARKDVDIYEKIFMEDEGPTDFSAETDSIGLDYMSYAAIAEAMGEGVEISEQDTWMAKAVGINFGAGIDYEFCYGSGWLFTPEEVAKIAAGLAEEGWDPDDDYEENVSKFFHDAASEGKFVAGGVS